MSQKIAEVRSKAQEACARIGKHNGHACPDTKSNIDGIMHDYMIATDCESYFKKRRDDAKKALANVYDTSELAAVSERVAKTCLTENGTVLARGDVYALEVDVKKPITRFDTTMLRNALAKQGMDSAKIDKLIASCTKQNKPAVQLRVVAR